MNARVPALLALSVAAGCGSSSTTPHTDVEFAASITQGMHDSLQSDLQALVDGTAALQQAAPTHAWDDTDPAFMAMQNGWVEAREAYERIEGATAPIFPDIDLSIDGRVEDFGPDAANVLTPSCDVFQGIDPNTLNPCFTGLHAAERIMYVNTTPASVKAYEQGLGYVPEPQAFPPTDADASDFKIKLCGRAASDATRLKNGWQPAVIDIGSAFQGLVSLMNEQREKVTKAGLNQEESRYSQRTMDDLRQNLTGTTKIYALFRPWIQSKTGGAAIDASIEAGFDKLNTLYNSSAYVGVAFPTPPDDWSDTNPSAADLQTPFGELYAAVLAAVDPTSSSSVVSQMNAAAVLCGLPTFSDQPPSTDAGTADGSADGL